MLQIAAAAFIVGTSITPTTLTAVCKESPALVMVEPSSPQVFDALKTGQCKLIGPYEKLVFAGLQGNGFTALAYEIEGGQVVNYWINTKDFKPE